MVGREWLQTIPYKTVPYEAILYEKMYRNRKLCCCSNWDYTTPGYYFVTICVQGRESIMSTVVNGKAVLNGLGIKIMECWEKLPNHYPNCELDEFIEMPEHFHGIVKLLPTEKRYPLWEIIRGFKTFSSKEINKYMLGRFKWQKSFNDRIIRDTNELNRIREYIKNNPKKNGKLKIGR